MISRIVRFQTFGVAAGVGGHDDMKQVQFGIILLGLVHCMVKGCIGMFGEIRAEQNVDFLVIRSVFLIRAAPETDLLKT